MVPVWRGEEEARLLRRPLADGGEEGELVLAGGARRHHTRRCLLRALVQAWDNLSPITHVAPGGEHPQPALLEHVAPDHERAGAKRA